MVLESLAGTVARPDIVEELDERAARRTLRAQIAKLERELADTVIAAYPRVSPGTASVTHAGPRLLTLGELERTRDDLAARVHDLVEQQRANAERAADARLLLERMLLEPSRYKWVRVSNEDLGEPGCKHWHVRPRLGLVGLLAGWWHVKISSGCPLAT